MSLLGDMKLVSRDTTFLSRDKSVHLYSVHRFFVGFHFQ